MTVSNRRTALTPGPMEGVSRNLGAKREGEVKEGCHIVLAVVV